MQMKQTPEEPRSRVPCVQRECRGDYALSTARALGVVMRVQTLVAVLLALALLLVGPVAAYSSLCGSLAVYLPGWLFTVLVSRNIGTSSKAFLSAAAIAEFGKLLLTGLLCAVVFIWIRPLAPPWFFAGMLSMIATSWVGLAKAIR